ncbi:basic blue protein [Iris pallida]|uniref:Basic blue protein n=1 Tax=Iris pallida TaxID=29817 RepID=A0AAX6FH21_IRIPA|nr:basic blue protein [Iris pallida]
MDQREALQGWKRPRLQLQFRCPQRGGSERRWLQRLQQPKGVLGAHHREGPRHFEEGDQLLHMQLRRILPGRDEDGRHGCLTRERMLASVTSPLTVVMKDFLQYVRNIKG